jgi:hypothetical protein
VDAHTVESHRNAEGDVGVAAAVDIRREDIDFMPPSSERPA